VSTSIGAAHATFHSEISLYLNRDRDPFMIPWLEKLIQDNKKIVDAGMAFAINTRRQVLAE